MSRFLCARFAALSPYVPGEQPRDKTYIKLNTNESPYPPSPGVCAAIDRTAVEQLRLYPDPDCRELIDALAGRYAVQPENVFVSNGSDDILNFAFMAFGGHDRPAVFPDITYGFYAVYANLHGVPYTRLPLQADFSIAPADYFDAGGMVVLANPNAQTGVALSVDAIEEIVRRNRDAPVIVDEAYVDFGCDSCVPLTRRYDNLLVVQTFSKSRNLAGARLGFAIGSPDLIADLNKLKYATNPYAINRLTQLGGIAALRDDAYYASRCRAIMETRAYTAAALQERGFTVLPSAANFLLAKSDRIPGTALYRFLKANGVLVRHFDDPARIAAYNRITIGTMQQIQSMLALIDTALKGADV